jgi:hypothetical protein
MATPYNSNIDTVFSTAARLNSLINILNWQLENRGYTQIFCGIGLAYGRALMLKAGYSGSGINDVIWMGDVVNEASNLCHQGNKPGYETVQVSTTVHGNLSDVNKGFLKPTPNAFYPTHYEGNIINIAMEGWLKEQKEKKRISSLIRRNFFTNSEGSFPTTLGGLLQIR